MVCASLAFIDGLGGPEMVLIFVIVLVLFGGQKLPEFARGLGKTIREFKKAASGVEEEFKRALEEDERKQTLAQLPAASASTTPAIGAGAAAAGTPEDPGGPHGEMHHYDETGEEISPPHYPEHDNPPAIASDIPGPPADVTPPPAPAPTAATSAAAPVESQATITPVTPADSNTPAASDIPPPSNIPPDPPVASTASAPSPAPAATPPSPSAPDAPPSPPAATPSSNPTPGAGELPR